MGGVLRSKRRRHLPKLQTDIVVHREVTLPKIILSNPGDFFYILGPSGPKQFCVSPPTVNTAPPTVNWAPPTVNTAPPTTVNKAPPTVFE